MMYVLSDEQGKDVILAPLKEVLKLANGLVGVSIRPAAGMYLESTTGGDWNVRDRTPASVSTD